MTSYDVVVIGSGVGGYSAAVRAGQLGLKVACVEKEVNLGGTCLNVGCMPSKALLHASELYELARLKFAELGIRVTPELDLRTMMAQKQESVTGLVRGVEFLLRKNKVERINGHAKLAGPGRVIVNHSGGSQTSLEARHVVIATGSQASTLPGLETDQINIVDSTGALELNSVPTRLIVVGGGIIGLELGSVWRRLGAQVEIVEFADHIIPGADSELVRAFARQLQKQGLKLRLSTKVVAARKSTSGIEVSLQAVGSGNIETVDADMVLVAVGRRPFTGDLGLETAGIALDAQGYIPTTKFSTTAKGVWAIGDVTRGPMLAHKAEEEAIACIETIAGQVGHIDYDLIPSVIYTWPEVAWVGKTEEQVKASGVPYKVGTFPFTANGRARINHEAEGFVKVISDSKDFRILGVHMFGPQVSEMIAAACLAMEFRADSEDVARVCHPHPTRSEAFRQAAMGVDGWTMQA